MEELMRWVRGSPYGGADEVGVRVSPYGELGEG